MSVNKALLDEFIVESNENLSTISQELTQFESKSNDFELLNGIYRKVHTLKGSAGFLGFQKLQKITHAAENLLDMMREKSISIDGDLADLLLKAFDTCQVMVRTVEATGEEGESDDELIASLEKIATQTNSSQDQGQAVGPENDILLKGDYVSDVPKDHQTLSENENPEQTEQKEQQQKEERKAPLRVVKEEHAPPASSASLKANVAESVIRVNVNLLDKIMNVVGELVLSRNQIVQYSNSSNDPSLLKLTHELNTITSELQNDIMNTRMQPVGSVLNKFERLVRDLSRSQKKKVKLSISGQETELDKTLLEAIKDPLTHIIRNCVDHGIETPEVRKEFKKNEEGQITIRAFHEGGQVAIEIRDDGGGINKERILGKAVDKGLLTEEQAKNYSENEILNLIFEPGFSTAEQVTNISGRGVGMDVVRTNIEKIGGAVNLSSIDGEGSTFKLKIPLTLAIIPALISRCHNEFFAIPQINLVELVRVDLNKNENQLESVNGSEFLRLRDELIPVLRLSKTLKISETAEKSQKMNRQSNDLKKSETNKESLQNLNSEDEENIIILNSDGNVFGLIVDNILDTEEIVVKPLSKTMKNLRAFAGATIMGDGKVALILDPAGFLSTAGFDKSKGKRKYEDELEFHTEDLQETLLFTLGDQRKYGIPLTLVNRLEEFPRDKVERSGDQHLVRYRDRPMPLLNLEKILGLEGQSALEGETEKVSCIVGLINQRFFGFVVNDIQDIAVPLSDIDSTAVDRKGIMGTVFLDEETISVVDLYQITDAIRLDKEEETSTDNLKILKNKKILMVDDSPLYRKILSDAVVDTGCEVFLAKDGNEGIELLNQRSDIDIIVTDIEMPHLNGFEFSKLVREHQVYKDHIIIAVSTRNSEKDRKRGVEAGFDYHLEKLKREELLGVLKECFAA